ncbi:MAG: hypothetical protein ABL967_00265 [Bryobacteraceae bacterium]
MRRLGIDMNLRKRNWIRSLVTGAAFTLSAQIVCAQQPAQEPKPGDILQLQTQTPKSTGPAKSGKAGAPFDVTGYWVAVINEDWRWRMITPDKGDFSSVPLNIEGRRMADAWDPAKDEASGEQCRVYGAPSIMRLPTRLHITWQDDNTLKIETDLGTQTRLLHFGETPGKGPRSWQGSSLAEWEADTAGAPPRRGGGPTGPRDLKVETTNLKAGYYRRNGIPYSENAKVTEYFDLFPKLPNGDEWMVVNAVIEDPQYLTERFILSSNFKREKDGSKWHPTPCTTR